MLANRQPQELRVQAAEIFAEANDEPDNRRRAGLFLTALTMFETIPDLQPRDIRYMAKYTHFLANTYFNLEEYVLAVAKYNKGLNLYQNVLCDDNDYRAIIALYIDLADAYMHLYQQPNAEQAFTFAISIFKRIVGRTPAELEIGDVDQNHQKFHLHFEQKQSLDKYLKSTVFSNHQTLLNQAQGERVLGGLFSGLGVTNATPIHSTATTPIFTPVAEQVSNDPEYRNLAAQYMQLANTQLKANNNAAALKTTEQALTALNKINENSRTPEDADLIQKLNVKLLSLQQGRNISPIRPSQAGVFARRDTEQDDDAMDLTVAWNPRNPGSI